MKNMHFETVEIGNPAWCQQQMQLNTLINELTPQALAWVEHCIACFCRAFGMVPHQGHSKQEAVV